PRPWIPARESDCTAHPRPACRSTRTSHRSKRLESKRGCSRAEGVAANDKQDRQWQYPETFDRPPHRADGPRGPACEDIERSRGISPTSCSSPGSDCADTSVLREGKMKRLEFDLSDEALAGLKAS